MERKLLKTADGSFTLRIESIDETYHSRHGAIKESQHVFIDSGLKKLDYNQNKILEIGFGTGLNAFLTLTYCKELKKKIFYTGIEPYPIELELIEKLNYWKLIPNSNKYSFSRIHNCIWGKNTIINDFFSLKKIHNKIELCESIGKYDLIYYDAFGFRAQPKMWKIEILEKCISYLNIGGVFVTYSAKGQLKRNLISLGMEVEKLKGPPGKREMIRAIKTQ